MKLGPKKIPIHYDEIEEINKTTVMISNIPNKFTETFLKNIIDKNHSGKYNWFNLPIDIKVIYFLLYFIKKEKKKS